MVYGRRVPVEGTILEKGKDGLWVYSYYYWTPEGKDVVQFEILKTSDCTIWVRMLYPDIPKDGVIRKKILKDNDDGMGVYFGFNYSGPFQIIYLDCLEHDKIILKGKKSV